MSRELRRVGRGGVGGVRLAGVAAALAALPAATASVVDIFEPGFRPVALAFDEFSGHLIAYPEFGDRLDVFDRDGALVRSVSVPWGSNDIDMDVAHVAMQIGTVVVPAGTLIVADGDAGRLLRAYDISGTSAVLLSQVSITGLASIVGLAVNPDGNSLSVLSWTEDRVFEVNPETGAALASFPVAPAGSPSFDVFYGDIEADLATEQLYLVSSSQNQFRRLNADGSYDADVLLSNIVAGMAGIAIDNDLGEIWVGSVNTSRIFRIVNVLNCPAELTGDGQVDSGDLSLFIVAFLAQDALADSNCDGEVDSGDLALFIELFIAGC